MIREQIMTSFNLLIFMLCLFNVNLSQSNSLEEVTDTELAKLINQEQYVLVLFSKSWKTT